MERADAGKNKKEVPINKKKSEAKRCWCRSCAKGRFWKSSKAAELLDIVSGSPPRVLQFYPKAPLAFQQPLICVPV